MKCLPDILPSMANEDVFVKLFSKYAGEISFKACLEPKLSLSRLRDTHFAWRDDLKRVQERETRLKDGLDHFKQCGHIAYWLRRNSPITDYRDLSLIFEGPDQLYPDEQEFRKVLENYGGEYMAFDFGLQICQYYEFERTDRIEKPRSPKISTEYMMDVCHMLKFKHVSPHSLYLIYRSLFI